MSVYFDRILIKLKRKRIKLRRNQMFDGGILMIYFLFENLVKNR